MRNFWFLLDSGLFQLNIFVWRGGRVVECGALEMRFGGNVNGGSNPPLSVFTFFFHSIFLFQQTKEIGNIKNSGVRSQELEVKYSLTLILNVLVVCHLIAIPYNSSLILRQMSSFLIYSPCECG